MKMGTVVMKKSGIIPMKIMSMKLKNTVVKGTFNIMDDAKYLHTRENSEACMKTDPVNIAKKNSGV